MVMTLATSRCSEITDKCLVSQEWQRLELVDSPRAARQMPDRLVVVRSCGAGSCSAAHLASLVQLPVPRDRKRPRGTEVYKLVPREKTPQRGPRPPQVNWAGPTAAGGS